MLHFGETKKNVPSGFSPIEKSVIGLYLQIHLYILLGLVWNFYKNHSGLPEAGWFLVLLCFQPDMILKPFLSFFVNIRVFVQTHQQEF